MIFSDAVDYFGVVVGGGVGIFLTREREDDAGVIAANGRKLVGSFAGTHFEAGPFAPEIDAGGGFHDVGNVRAADAGGNFDEIEFAVGVGFQEFSVRYAAQKTQAFQQSAIEIEERFGFHRVARQRSRGEDAALMRSIERGRAIGVGLRELYIFFGHYAVYVEHRAGNELLEQVEGLLIAELLEERPEFRLVVEFFHADAARLGAGL